MSNADIPIDGLSVAEKLHLMEHIWGELELKPSEVPVPEWHGDVLDRRVQSIKDGETEFLDWSDAKQRLQRRHP